MAESNTRDKLFNFLDRKAFRPVLNASADDYSGSDREKLEEVQAATRRERKRFEERDSASGIMDEFKNDLSSEPAEKIHHKLRSLGLPTLPEVKDEFRDLAKREGVG